jgi:predicted O-methyltransferase YrrM
MEASPAIGHRLREHIRTLYATGKIRGETGREFDLFPTGFPEGDGEALRDLAVREGAARTIETGFAFGLSSLFLCEALLASGREDARHVAIDPDHFVEFDAAGRHSLREAGVGHLLEFVPEASDVALPRLEREGRRFDLGFVDGSHLFDDVLLDVHYLSRMVRPGGLIVLDDAWMRAVRVAIDFSVTNLGHRLERAPFPSGAYCRDRPMPWSRFQVRKPRVAVLRLPEKPLERGWDHYVPFA